MKFSNSALRADLGNRLQALQGALGLLSSHIQLRARDVWLWRAPEVHADALSPAPPELPRESALEAAAHTITQIKYEDGQDPHESLIAPGVLVLSDEGLELARQVNQCKRALAKVLRQIGDRKETDLDPLTQQRVSRPLREVALEGFFFRRLNYFQATREFVILQPSPDSISFFWARLREIRRTSREHMLEELAQSAERNPESSLIDQDMETLRALPQNEPLALVRGPQISPRANIVWASPDGVTRASKTAVLPLLMPGTRKPTNFRALPPKPLPETYRLQRSDIQIQLDPILLTRPIYRYLPEHRAAKRADRSTLTASETHFGPDE